MLSNFCPVRYGTLFSLSLYIQYLGTVFTILAMVIDITCFVLLEKVAARGRALFRLFQHPSLTIVKGAGLIMKALIEEGEPEIGVKMQVSHVNMIHLTVSFERVAWFSCFD
jgi:hypothetical protein